MRSPVRFHGTSIGRSPYAIEAGFPIRDAAIPVLPQASNLELEFCRQQEIIAVEILNEFAARCETSCLARRARSAVLTVDRANFRMSFLPTLPLRVPSRRSIHRRR